jgi:hypothetical protein
MVEPIKNTSGESDDGDAFDADVKVAKRMLRGQPNMQTLEFFNKIMLPLLEHIREDQAAMGAVLDEAFDDGDEEEVDSTFVDKSAALVLNLATLVEIVLVEAGFKNKDTGDWTERAPADVVEGYNGVSAMLAGFNDDVAAFREALSEGGDEQEGASAAG